MRTAFALSLLVLAAHFGPSAEARAQSARRGPYYSRTATTRGRSGMSIERGVGSFEATSAVETANLDLLAPYTSRPTVASGTYSSEPRVAPPPSPRPRPPVPRNFYPTARVGQSTNSNVILGGGRRHCTPSRGGSLGR